jgi:tricorn protease
MASSHKCCLRLGTALIIDVRNNRGGNIDSWILDVLHRKVWMYWQSRTNEETTLWNSRFAFRGHLIVLMNEHTSSDGEAFARGVSELGLGKLVGKRTWGGGIWLSSDNTLVDGGIASAPEIGTFNDRFGWGLGIEQMGVEPDFEVDNNPRSAFKGEDAQLTQAVSILKDWLDKEPITFPKVKPKKNVVATEKCFK